MCTHTPVLLHESIQALAIRPGGVYVDATYGRGGHSKAILQKLDCVENANRKSKGRLIVFDKDKEAIIHAQQLACSVRNVQVVHADFSTLHEWLIAEDVQIDGVLFDLGVSSTQIDNAARGFSFQRDGVLDMRMNATTGITAQQWLDTVQVDELAKVIARLGEERFAKSIAKAICDVRPQTTLELAHVVTRAQKNRDKHKHPATRTFQAIRMYINHELESLHAALHGIRAVMRQGARLVVISFHSLEDRLVKRFLRLHSGIRHPPSIPTMQWHTPPVFTVLGKVFASSHECCINPRSRSAVMRVAEFVGTNT